MYIYPCTLQQRFAYIVYTDFDKDYEYLTVLVNDQYLGICEGGKQMDQSQTLIDIAAEDAYWNNYTYWCFRQVDISRYTNIEPDGIEIRLELQDTVDRNWLDASPTQYLLDALVKIECTELTQDDLYTSSVTYDRRTTSSNYPYPQELSFKCQEIECGELWNWNILGSCPHPILSIYYSLQHYDDSMIEIRINEQILGYCGPVSDTENISLSIQYGMANVRTCVENMEIIELLQDIWDLTSDSDAVHNDFQIGFALTEIDILDNIINGSVAHLFINLDCSTSSSSVSIHVQYMYHIYKYVI